MTKHQFTLGGAILCTALALILAACKKHSETTEPRTIRYILYTKEDFSDDNDTIRFRLHIHTTGTTGRVLFDSNIAAMRIKEVPDSLHRLVFTKIVPPGHDTDKLVVGFVYDIDNVGEGWYLDSSFAGQKLKAVEYSFK
ncbi:MAG TPA: hypothetical protein VGM89_10695 [Puia sp.]